MTAYEAPHSIELAHPARKRIQLGIYYAPDILHMGNILRSRYFILSNNDQFTHCAENAQFSACFSTSALRSTTRSPSYTDAIRTVLTDRRAPARIDSIFTPVSSRTRLHSRVFWQQPRLSIRKRGPQAPFFVCMSSYMRHNYSAHCARRSNRTPRGNRSRSTSRRSPATPTPP